MSQIFNYKYKKLYINSKFYFILQSIQTVKELLLEIKIME